MSASQPSLDMSPSRYIEKVSLLTGEPMADEIQPRQLLVRNHRDYHVADIQARRFMSHLMRATGSERLVLKRMKELRDLGHRAAEMVAKILHREDPKKVARFLFGLREREYYYRFKKPDKSGAEIAAAVERLQDEAAARLEDAQGSREGLHLLLTGGTGFVGKELLWQAAHDDDVARVVVLIRPKKERRSNRVLQPAERGARLLDELGLLDEHRQKYRFVAGDIEEPGLGIAEDDLEELQETITHVVHSAASVAFDAPYEESFQANVLGTLNALDFSHRLQSAPQSPFVAHVGIETSYIHGRQVRLLAREDEIVFPRNFYNNFYELTKAMASLESERYMLERGLRLVQLCPAIVIGDARTGNNRGDSKVVNAPVNLFGLAHQALTKRRGGFVERSKAAVLARMACVFPGDPSAQINLIPVDWVVSGIRAALKRPQAVGRRIHLATDKRVTSEEMSRILREEVGAEVKLAEPTLHRTVTQPVLTRLLTQFKQPRLANALEKLGSIFGGYSEWGQPIHEVGKDVTLLGLPAERPDTQSAFRMLCRHNRYVLEFGRVRDAAEVARRERLWQELVAEMEASNGGAAGAMAPGEFQRLVGDSLDLERFERRS